MKYLLTNGMYVLTKGMRKLDACHMNGFRRLERSEEAIAILRLIYRLWLQTAKQNKDRISNRVRVVYERFVMSAQMLEVSLQGVWKKRDAWSMVK